MSLVLVQQDHCHRRHGAFALAVAERVSPRVAGLLSGYPLGAAIALFFMGLEIGPISPPTVRVTPWSV